MQPRTEIFYLLAIPASEPHQVTPFQGFAPGLIDVSPLLTQVVRLPADLAELTMDPPDRLTRRRAGGGDWMWSPVTIDNLEQPGRRPTPIQPSWSCSPPTPLSRAAWPVGVEICAFVRFT